MINTLTIDIETTIRNKVGNNKASAFCSDNEVVLWAVKLYSWDKAMTSSYAFKVGPDPVDLIVGQNFKFDIQYIHRDSPQLYEYLIGIDWWDTSVAEYILTAQQKKYPSLDYLSAKYGGTQKIDKIKEYWEQGVDTTEIPLDLLTEYAIADVENTELVAHKQIEVAKKRGMYDLIILMSNASKAYAEMEYNGLTVDLHKLKQIETSLEAKRDSIRAELYDLLYTRYPEIPTRAWNIDSAAQLSSIMFGGTIKWHYTEVVGTKTVKRKIGEEPNGLVKSGPNKGKTKYKCVYEYEEVDDKKANKGEVEVNVLKLRGKKEWENNNGYTTNDAVLNEILDWANNRKHKPQTTITFIESILELRKLNKLINTYCYQLKELVFGDGCIHHNLNNVATDTSRLSSSNPNMQNIPAGRIKEVFTSRFGEEGYLVQVDYSQLEVVWQAFVSGDENLKQGIRDGVDFHCKRLSKQTGVPYEEVVHKCKVEEDQEWVKKRKEIKTFTFQRAYGAGAKSIAKNTGLAVDEVKELIKNEIQMYPKVEEHFQRVKQTASTSIKHSAVLDRQVGYFRSCTGRAYHYPLYESDYRPGEKSLSPTQLRNYDIQGGATGDLVPAYIYFLFTKLFKSGRMDKIKLINTIHDSIMLDVHQSVVKGVCKGLKHYLEDTSVLKDSFGIDFDIPLRVDVEYGRNWGDMSTYNGEIL